MKKILKMTLFKKIFLSIFCIILCIEGFHAYHSYNEMIAYQKSTLYSEVGKGAKDLFIAGELFETKYKDIYDKNFLDEFQEKTTSLSNYNCMILDNDYEEVNHGEYWDIEHQQQIILSIDDGNEGYYYINLISLNREVLTRLENQLVRLAKQNKPSTILLNEEDIKQKTGDIKGEELKYLNVNGEDIINQESQTMKEFIVTSYVSQNYDIQYHSNTYTYFIDKILAREQIKKSIVTLEDTQFVIDDNIYARITHKLKDAGYIVIYAIDYNGVSELQEVFYNQWASFYVLLFIIILLSSWFISYMITSRIKRIDQMTEAIASHDFEVKLKETPRDELGNLSKNINHMSLQLEKTIKQLNEEINHVKELESLRKDFINQFTHEMKTPLGIINGYSELIDETDNDEEREKYLTIINRETTRINQLIQSMLSLSRLESGKVELKKEDFDLEDSVTGIIDEYEVLLMKKNIQVKVNTIQPCIYADQEFMETVIHNFLSNAIKHAYENSNIIITIHQGISVYNEGKPILEERLENIWYTFVTHDKEGSGLGLAICRSILELHGFKYGIINKDNGVEFYFKDEL